MAEGILKAQGEILLFVDADLLDLSPAHIAQILYPLLGGAGDMVIGCPGREQGIAGSADLLRPLSGERALLRKDFLPLVASIRDSRFGVETLINLHYRKEGKRIGYIPLAGLIHPIKLEKAGLMEALGMYTRAATQIAQAVTRHYPLAMAAFGLDPERAWRWWGQVGYQPSAERLVLWTQQASHGAKRIVLNWREPSWRGTSLLCPREQREGVTQPEQCRE